MSEFDIGGWMGRMAERHERTYGAASRDSGERLVLKTAYEERYGATMDPATTDPLELALIDAMYAEYLGTPSDRIDSPETFWPMAKYIHLPGMARVVLRTLADRAQLTQAALPFSDAA
ncbi:MAG: hypothetical protein IT337_09290 [Thermomicrobiales bacterium]|nr:hypothetical protein [Thermomicrobiales bacterium]